MIWWSEVYLKFWSQKRKQFRWCERKLIVRTSESILSRIFREKFIVQCAEEWTEDKKFVTECNITFAATWLCI